jgi:hypothetical protein
MRSPTFTRKELCVTQRRLPSDILRELAWPVSSRGLPLKLGYHVRGALQNYAPSDLTILEWGAALERLMGPEYSEPALQPEPAIAFTRAERVRVLARRQERGQALWHPGDVVRVPPDNHENYRAWNDDAS